MYKNYQNLNNEIKEYFKILSPDFPDWLNDYINTEEMQRVDGISNSCGTDYSKLIGTEYWYSNLTHSIGVALIIWNFTHSKEQTLAGLFHDIATPAFKHCIDFMNGDAKNQESTEERTESIILASKDIMNLLKRDNIDYKKVNDYKIYPIADNDMPKLSADRLEYTFSSGLVCKRVWNLENIRKCYENIIILKNEDGVEELGFKDKEIAESFIHTLPMLWSKWISDKDRIAMQFIADITKSMIMKKYITVDDLYKLSDKEVIEKINTCPDKNISSCFKKFQNTTEIFTSNEKVKDKYCTSILGKIRYVNPLIKINNVNERISVASNIARDDINNFLNGKHSKYIYFNFDFKPY